MNIQELLDKWKKGELNINEVTESARKKMKDRGMINTNLLGWIHKKELERLIKTGTIKKIKLKNKLFGNYDYAFTSEKIEENDFNSNGGKSKLTSEARKYLFPDYLMKNIDKLDNTLEDLF